MHAWSNPYQLQFESYNAKSTVLPHASAMVESGDLPVAHAVGLGYAKAKS